MVKHSSTKKTIVDSATAQSINKLPDVLLKHQPKLQFSWWLLAVPLAASLIVMLLGFHSLAVSREYATQNAKIQSQNLAQSINQNITATIKRLDHTLLSVVHEIEQNLAAGNLDLAHTKQILTYEGSLLPEAVAIRVTNAEGRVILNNPSMDPSVSFADRTYFPYLREHPEAGMFITKPIIGLFTKKWVITFARRYNLPDGRFGGVVIAPVLVEHFQKSLSGFDVGSGGMLTLRDEEGGFVVRHTNAVKSKIPAIGDTTISPEFLAIIKSGVAQKTFSAIAPFDQIRRMLTLQRIESAPFFVIASLAEENYLAQWKRDRTTTLTILLVFLVGFWILTGFLWYFGKRRVHDANALYENADRLQTILQTTKDGFWMVNTQGRLAEVNEAYCKMSGYSEQELLAMSISALEAVETAADTTAHILKVIKCGEDRFESRHRRKDGSSFDVEVSVQYRHLAGGQLVAFLRDITERKRAEEQLTFIMKAVESSSDAIGISDAQGHHIFQNKALSALFEYETAEELAAAGGGRAIVREPAVAKEMFDNIMSGKPWSGELAMVTKSGRVFPAYERADAVKDHEGRLIGLIGIVSDITEKKLFEVEREKFERQRNQTQKLEALGLLAGGIAHDFNNLMGGIFGYIDLAIEEIKDSNVTTYLSKAMNTIDRARGLTTQLLTFAKGGAPIQKIGPLFPFVQETAKFALSGANVSCHFDVPQGLWVCNFDKNQIGQVIDNIIINAQQAMPVGGTIELAARNIVIAEQEHPTLTHGYYIKLSIKDSGIGIPKELIRCIFDPFFTTKATGHGLGLATCYSIINRHGGCIDVESEPGKGSIFHVFLPADPGADSSYADESFVKHTGSGTFLIMDDEEVMRETIRDMLVALGYTVVCKANGQKAVDFFAAEMKEKRPITGIIFDLTVPGGMGGKAAVEEIRKLNTEIPIFVASGYAEDPVMKNPTEYGFTASICKPFRKNDLAEMLNKYLKTQK